MKCNEVRSMLSAYHDGELPVDRRTAVADHLEQCRRCQPQLAAVQRLSQLVRSAEVGEPPPDLWAGIEAKLNAQTAPARSSRSGVWLRQWGWVIATAALLWVSVVAWFGYGHLSGFGHQRRLAGDFAQYIDTFHQDPSAAQRFLLTRYEGKSVGWPEAADALGYRPSVTGRLPDAYSLESAYVWDMPCCRCLQLVCRRSDGSTVAIFEHENPQPDWFGKRPVIAANCCGQRCSITQVDQQLAASWALGQRQVTVVGARDLEEVTNLVGALADAPSA
jgi:hypothetical protein